MAIRTKISDRSKTATTFRTETRNRFPGEGEYNFKVKKSRFKKDTKVLVLNGTPYLYDENGDVIEYEDIFLCVRTWVYNDEQEAPITILLDAFELDAESDIDTDYFVGKEFVVYIGEGISKTGSTLYQGEDFAI